ncbi:MAG: TRAP transporter substrate-binding protein [Desulfuromonadales bacterium]|nr:TRAP transporter substrate-binding protein [Desulfuromonadales bacterium]MBN2792532.1 TRAP transporter substrate-binding protein [Desulfuromonadales bacterium]
MRSSIKCFAVLAFIAALFTFVSLTTAAEAKTYRLNLSTGWPTSYNYLMDPVFEFAKKVEERTEGKVKITVYHSAQLFKGKEELPALERGDVDMTASNDVYLTGIIPELGILSLPFQWESNDSFQRSLDAGLLDLGIKQKFLEHNVVLLSAASSGGYQVYAKDKPVITPEDFKGRIWGVSGSTASKTVEVLGGTPTTMGSGELYMALQRSTIDGTTRPLITGDGRKLDEVINQLTVTNMYYFTSMLLINKDVWDDIPKEYQEIIQQAAYERNATQSKILKEYENSVIDKYKSKGVSVHIPTSAELQKFKDKVQPVYDWWYSVVKDGKKYTDFVEKNH